MGTYRPRATAVLKLPFLGTSAQKQAQETDSGLIDLPLRCQRVEWKRSDHNHADEARVSVEWYDAGIDPRYLSNAILSVYIGQADDSGNFNLTDDALRFIGIVTRPQRASAADGRLTVDIEAVDLTSLFLRTKPFRTIGVPSLSMTLSDAWRLICDQTGFYDHQAGKFVSTVQSLRSRLKFIGGAKDVQLGSAAPPRFQGAGKVHVKPESDAWAVWQQCVGMLGLMSYIDRGDCIVTTALDHYSAADPVRFIYGVNVLEHAEVRNCARSAIGVGLSSFDPISGKTIEAFWPPLGGQTLTTGKPRGKQKRALPEGAIEASKYEIFPYPGVSDPDLLLFAAQRVFEEFSRQDAEGSASTGEMVLPTLSGGTRDVMALQPGDAMRFEFDEGLKSALISRTSIAERVYYLTARGYATATAQLIAANVDDLSKLKPECSVKTVTVDFEATDEGGRFDVAVGYNARIQITGDTDPSP